LDIEHPDRVTAVAIDIAQRDLCRFIIKVSGKGITESVVEIQRTIKWFYKQM
jgi:hypothetical protein